MHDRSLDSMASDSYLLKAAPASCPQWPQWQPPCQGRPAKARRSTSWRVVVALVLLLVAVMGLAALAYLQRMELLDMRSSVANIRSELKDISLKLERLHSYELFRAFEADPNGSSDYSNDYEDGDDDDVKSESDADPIYPDNEDTNVVEGKAHDPEDGARALIPKLEPASGHQQPVDAAPTTASPDPMIVERRRREVRQAGRPQPQLKLYHMLQTPGLSAAAPHPEQPWSQYGARHPQDRAYGYGRPQPMYAEHAPMAFVPPPPRHALGYAATTVAPVAPVASRRSRVMDGVGASPGPGQQHRRRHQHRPQSLQQRQQAGFQLQNLQDVTQEVPQGGTARSVEVGRPRWQQQQQWPSSTPRPSWRSPTERAGRWRDPWQERVRATRVTDTHQR